MKKYNLFKVVGLSFLFIVLLTWILPGTAYDGTEYVSVGMSRMGVWDLFNYPLEAFHYFANMLLFVLVVGGFYGVLNKLDAYHKMMKDLADKLKKNKKYVLVGIILIFALLAALLGVSLELFVFVPFVMTLVLLLGYDKMTSVSVTVGAIAVGMMGTLFGEYPEFGMASIFSIEPTYLMLMKVILLVGGVALLSYYTLSYAKKIEKKKSESLTKGNEEDSMYVPYKKTDKKKIGVKSYTNLIVVFGVVALMIILGFMPWVNAFNVNAFYNMYESVTTVAIGEFAIFGELLGANTYLAPLGEWYLNDLTLVIILAIVFIKFAYKVRFNELFDGFYEGAKKLLPAALILMVVNGILIISANTYIFATILNWLLGLTDGVFNVITMTFAGIFQALGYIQMQYVVGFGSDLLMTTITDTSLYGFIALIFQSTYGLMLLIAPTSLILLPVLAYTRVSYTKWVKYIAALLLMLFGLTFVVFVITSLL